MGSAANLSRHQSTSIRYTIPTTHKSLRKEHSNDGFLSIKTDRRSASTDSFCIDSQLLEKVGWVASFNMVLPIMCLEIIDYFIISNHIIRFSEIWNLFRIVCGFRWWIPSSLVCICTMALLETSRWNSTDSQWHLSNLWLLIHPSVALYGS